MIYTDVFLEPCQTSTMERFRKDTVFLAVDYFCKHAPSYMLNRIIVRLCVFVALSQ